MGKAPKKPDRAALEAKVARLTKQLADARKTVARLEAQANVDGLLDLPNRRGFERELRRSIAYLKRYKATAALIYVDVDGLKPINDSLGHAAGDAVLRRVAAVLQRQVRMSDVVARLGGDEFGLLLWHLSPQDAALKALALEQAVDALDVRHRGIAVAVGASAGVAVLEPADSPREALDRADRAMYLRKRARRAREQPDGAASKR